MKGGFFKVATPEAESVKPSWLRPILPVGVPLALNVAGNRIQYLKLLGLWRVRSGAKGGVILGDVRTLEEARGLAERNPGYKLVRNYPKNRRRAERRGTICGACGERRRDPHKESCPTLTEQTSGN